MKLFLFIIVIVLNTACENKKKTLFSMDRCKCIEVAIDTMRFSNDSIYLHTKITNLLDRPYSLKSNQYFYLGINSHIFDEEMKQKTTYLPGNDTVILPGMSFVQIIKFKADTSFFRRNSQDYELVSPTFDCDEKKCYLNSKGYRFKLE